MKGDKLKKGMSDGDEGGNWISGAIKKPGALTAQAHVVGESPMGFAASHLHAPGKTGQRARFAEILQGFHKG